MTDAAASAPRSLTAPGGDPAVMLEGFGPEHLPAALELSRAERWPHRAEDWDFIRRLSRGVVATCGPRVVGTAFATPFGRGATVNTIIVAADMRGRGLGRRLVAGIMALAAPEEWRLVATEDGLPLYRKLGFIETGRILQHQGRLRPAAGLGAADPEITWAGEDMTAVLASLAAMDRAATGMQREALIVALAAAGRVALLRRGGRVRGYAVLRPFGLGEVIGPVVAPDAAAARALIAFACAGRERAFLRVDTAEDSLCPWLAELGLAGVGVGTAMRLGPEPEQPPGTEFTTYALAAQALG